MLIFIIVRILFPLALFAGVPLATLRSDPLPGGALMVTGLCGSDETGSTLASERALSSLPQATPVPGGGRGLFRRILDIERLLPEPAQNEKPRVEVRLKEGGTEQHAPADIDLIVEATDTDGAVLNVSVYGDGELVAEFQVPPYDVTLSGVGAGEHRYRVRAVDDDGAEAWSSEVLVSISDPPPTPRVELLRPEPGAVFQQSAPIVLGARLSGFGTGARVEFVVDGTQILRPAAGSLEMVWEATTAGAHRLVARGIDDRGLRVETAPCDVIIETQKPPPLPEGSYDFEPTEGFSIGGLDGQMGWRADPGVDVVAMTEPLSTQSVMLSAVEPPTRLWREIGRGSNPVFIDFLMRPAAADFPGLGAMAGTDAARVALANEGGTGGVYACDGNSVAWIRLGADVRLDDWGRPIDWLRITLREDFARQRWDLYANGRLVGFDLRFAASLPPSAIGTFEYSGAREAESRFDDFYVGAENPLFDDADRDGLPDDWEQAHGLDRSVDDRERDHDADGVRNAAEFMADTRPDSADTDQDGAPDSRELSIGSGPHTADTDGDGMADGWEVQHGLDPLFSGDASADSDSDGYSNRDESVRGTDPLVFFDSGVPELARIDQPSSAGIEELALAVKRPDGTAWAGAPVLFRVAEGTRKLSADPLGSNFSNEVRVVSGADGIARVFLEADQP